jgi:hypothetical protein
MYSAAATRIYEHFTKHAANSPDPSTIEALIDAAFWASLRREEGFVPKISLAWVAPEQVPRPLKLSVPLPLSSRPLTRLAPAVERPGIHLGVWPRDGHLLVWGATRNLPPLSLVVEVVAPGVIVLKHSRMEDAGKFINIAVLSGEEVKIIDQNSALVPDCPALLTSLLGLETQFGSPDAVNVLIQLAVSMREHERGGLLLVVPSNSEAWRESVLHPITYSVDPPFEALRELMEEEESERGKRKWQDALRRAVDGVGGLTAVDGATVITQDYLLLAFGAKIIRRPRHAQISTVILTEPVEGIEPAIVAPSQVGGTRHLSAAQFAHDQKDAIALTASQDGRFTVFAWSPCENMVHAHRIESLLL